MKSALKKAISILLVAVMVFGTAPLAGFVGLELPELNPFVTKAEAEEAPTSGTCGDNLTWIFDESTGTLTISGTGEMTNWSSPSYIPPWYDYRLSINHISIDDGVTTIGNMAFCDCTRITSITIPDGVTSIGYFSFAGCSVLTTVIIPDSVTHIGEYAFVLCKNLWNIEIPDSVTNIGENAFCDCKSITRITVPDSVTSIGELAFGGCTSLISITVDTDNPNYSSDEYGVMFNKDKTVLIQYPSGNTQTNYTIPDSVTRIGYFSFGACQNLVSITMPDSVTAVDDGAFYGSAKIESIKIPDGVKNIGISMFYGCLSLKDITIPPSVESVESNAFSLCLSLKNVYYGGSKADWEKIKIDSGNTNLSLAKIYYNYVDIDNLPVVPEYDYAVVDSNLMPMPTKTSISYGDAIILHIDLSKIPEGGYVEWYPSNGNFGYSVSADGTTCKITSSTSGDTTFTALIYDAEGNIVSADTQTMTSKAGFFDKIIAFFKKLFGLTKTIPEAIKGIY